MFQIWKDVRIFFSLISHGEEVSLVERGDFHNFTVMDEAVNDVVPSEDLDSDDDISQS